MPNWSSLFLRPIRAAALALAAVSVLPGSALAAPQQPGQLDNPGGETSVAVRLGAVKGAVFFDLPGWTDVAGAWVAQTGAFSGVSAHVGGAFLRPREGAAVRVEQLVELGESPPQFLIAGAFARTWRGRDVCRVEVAVLDRTLGELAVADTGPLRPKRWSWHQARVAVPSGAAYARVALIGERHDGKDCDSFFDGVTLERLGRGEPPEFAELSSRDLQARLQEDGLDWPSRRALWNALAFRDRRGAEAVAELSTTVKGPATRGHLLTLATLCGDRRAAETALQVGLRAKDATVRATAFALLDVAPVDTIDLLVDVAARAGKNAGLLRSAVEALLKTGDRDAIRALQKLSRDEAVAVQILQTIERSGVDPDLVYRPLLSRYLAESTAEPLRRAAMRALGRLGDERFLFHLQDLAEFAGPATELAVWFRLAAAIDPVEGLGAVLATIEAEVPAAPAAFLAAADSFGGEAIPLLRREALDSDYPAVRLGAVRALAAHPDPDNVDALRRCLADPDPLVAVEAVTAVAAVTGGDATRMLDRLVDRGRPEVAAAALRSRFERAGGDAAAVRQLLEIIAEHDAWQARAAALRLLSTAAVRDGREVVIGAFDDEVWQVRAAAYGALARLRENDSVPPLIAQLGRESGSAQAFLVDALVDLTGVDRGTDRDVWGRWWGAVESSFAMTDKPREVKRTTGGNTVTYHGIPVRSDRIVFIIDLSGSMNAKMKAPAGRTSSGAGDETTRLLVAKQELLKVLSALQPSQFFNVIGFGTRVLPFEPELLPASEENIADASEWVRRLKIIGATNIFDSVETALNMQGVESIFLLSDGGPSAGKFTDMVEIRRVVKLLNQDRRVRINTIMIGGSSRERAFMKRLADENDGNNR